MNLRKIELTSEERQALKEGYENGKKPVFRKRCHIVLLKGEGRTSKDVGRIVGMGELSVNSWLSRYEQEGLAGLHTRSGQGRRPVFSVAEDEAKVRAQVTKERQRLKLAKSELERELGKEFSLMTLKRLLKKLSANGSA